MLYTIAHNGTTHTIDSNTVAGFKMLAALTAAGFAGKLVPADPSQTFAAFGQDA